MHVESNNMNIRAINGRPKIKQFCNIFASPLFKEYIYLICELLFQRFLFARDQKVEIIFFI